MKKKIFRDYTNTLCQMLVGWRMAEDLDRIAALGGGKIEIDIVRATISHNGQSVEGFRIPFELQAWLSSRLHAEGISSDVLQQATIMADLVVETQNKRKGAKSIRLLWDARCFVRTKDGEYHGYLKEPHTWVLTK